MNSKESKSFLIVFMILLIITSCNNKDQKKIENIVKKSIGRNIILPTTLNLYQPFVEEVKDSLSTVESSYKVYARVDVSCGSCLSKIKLWNDLLLELDAFDISLIMICESEDHFELFKYLCETEKIKPTSYPFFLDDKNDFLKKNKFLKNHKQLETVLVNHNNEIIVVGDATKNKKMKELYLKVMSEL